jgi:tetratricopeptide (TPR) repeat protein
MSSWSRATSEGHELMQSGQADKTSWELRNKAYASVKKHITNRSPIILFRYFEIIRTIRNSRDPLDQLYLRFTLEFVLQMAETVLHPSHPIRLLTRLLLHPQAYQIIGPLAQQGFQKSLEILFQKCGPQHPRILYVLDSWTQTLLDEHQYEDAIRKAESYLERANSIQGTFYSYESCQALRMMGDAYAAQNQFDRATEIYNKAFAMQTYLPSSEDRGVVGVKTKRGLAAIAMQQKRFKHAEEDLQEALQIGKDTFGEDDVEVKLAQKDLNALKEKCEEVRRHRGELVYRPLNA